jgi:hypothetical protein
MLSSSLNSVELLLRIPMLAASAMALLAGAQVTAQAQQPGPVLGRGLWPDGAASGGYEAPYRVAQNASNLTLSVLVDTKKNQEFLKADTGFTYYLYGAQSTPGLLKVELASKEIIGTWKGNATIKERGFNQNGYIEDDSQFAPIFLVADVRNDGTRAAQVTAAFLDISESYTDFQPYLEIGDWGRLQCGDGSYLPAFEMANYGWGAVRNARMTYSFGGKSTRTSEFVSDLGTFDQTTTATVEDGFRKSALNIDKIKAGKFKCASKSQVPACFARLKETGILGNLANFVYTAGIQVYTDVAGRFEYEWTSDDQKTNSRVSPFAIVIPIFHFDVGGGPECGAPGPIDRNEKPVELSLDRKNYRIPLSWRGQLGSRQDKRFSFSLVAAKSSHHTLKLVVQFADGNTLTSIPVDISYFKPRMPPPPPEDQDDKK